MENNNILKPDSDKALVIEKYNTLISTTRGNLFSGLGYEQKGALFYNKAYFNVGQIITYEYIKEQVEEGERIIGNLKAIIHQIDKETILNDVQKKLIKDRIIKAILLLKYHQNTIYIEAEKAGHKLSNKERIIHRKEVLRIEDILYGEDITKHEERKNKVINKFHNIYRENSKELTKEEQNLWQEKILNIFKPSISIDNIDKKTQEKDMYIDESHIFDLVSLLLEIEGFKKDDIIKIQIDDTIKDIFINQSKGIYNIPSTRKEK